MSEKKQQYRTPVGFAMWAWLNKPKPPFGGDADKGAKYMIDVCFDRTDPKWKEWGAEFKRAAEAVGGVGVKLPIKQEIGEDEQPTGRMQISFKTSEKFKPDVFDKFGKKIPENVLLGNGSKVRVAYTINKYDGFGGGINLYLSAVQVVELVEYQGRSAEAYGFDVEPAPAGGDKGYPSEWDT